MKQVWLVLWKDIRSLRLELCVYVLLLVSFAVAAPQVRSGQPTNQMLAMFVTLLKVLIPACWMVMIARSVHADNLLGEEQFWITRPYRWQALLGAKALFVMLCVGFPFALMQWVMLLVSGLNPLVDKDGMALTLMRFTLHAWLPLLVLASVTENLASMFTFVVALMVAWAGLLTFVLSGTDMRMSPPYSLAVFCVVMGGLMLTILIYQYARRRTLQSRWAIVGVLVLFLLMIFGYDRGGFGSPVKRLIRSHYSVTDSLRLVFLGTVPYDERFEDMQVPGGMVEIKLPVRIEGLPADVKLRETYVAVEIEGEGERYAPPWESARVGTHTVGFLMPKHIFDSLAAANAKVHMELVAEEWRPERVLDTKAAGRFAGPMNGICSLVEEKVYCHYPYREWIPARVEAVTCGGATSAVLRHVPAGTAPDPVVMENLPLRGKVCAGDAVRFTEYGIARRFRLAMDLYGVKIGAFRGR